MGEYIKLWSFSKYQWGSSVLDSRGVRKRCGPEFIGEIWDPLQGQPGTTRLLMFLFSFKLLQCFLLLVSGSWHHSLVIHKRLFSTKSQ